MNAIINRSLVLPLWNVNRCWFTPFIVCDYHSFVNALVIHVVMSLFQFTWIYLATASMCSRESFGYLWVLLTFIYCFISLLFMTCSFKMFPHIRVYMHVIILRYVYFSLFSLPAGDLHLQLQTNKGSVCFSPNLPMYIIVKFQ